MNLLLDILMIYPCFKNVYMHAFVHDAQGRKMSKSLGNYILPEEVLSKYGADTLRYYTIGGASPGIELNYNFDDMKIKFKNLNILWNLGSFIIDLAKTNKLKPKKVDNATLSDEDKYILSKLNSAIKKYTERADAYALNELPWIAEDLYLELSRTYIQLIREQSSIGSEEEKQHILNIIHEVFINVLKLMAPVMPFITEAIYQDLKEEFSLKTESIHLYDWPKFDESEINKGIEKNFQTAKDVIQTVLFGREKAHLGLRWPIKEVFLERRTLSAFKHFLSANEQNLYALYNPIYITNRAFPFTQD